MPTIGDVIDAKVQADASLDSATAAAAAADAALAAAETVDAAANSALGTALPEVGGSAYDTGPDGNLTVYVVDTSAAGFHSFEPAPASTPLPSP